MIPFFPMILSGPPVSPGAGGNRHPHQGEERTNLIEHKDSDLLEREDEWWTLHHSKHSWARTGDYSDFASAYYVGGRGYLLYGVDGLRFLEAEEQLRRDYEHTEFWLRWDEVRAGCHAAWTRMEFQYNASEAF